MSIKMSTSIHWIACRSLAAPRGGAFLDVFGRHFDAAAREAGSPWILGSSGPDS